VGYKGLKRRAIRRKPGSKKPEHITPKQKRKGAPYSRTKEYQYFEGHIVPEVAKQLPSKNVVCWHNDHMLSLPVCAIKKFWQLQNHCKRCPLFQKDEHSTTLRSLIEEWEKDDLEKENK
jgi:hypothetical protein